MKKLVLQGVKYFSGSLCSGSCTSCLVLIYWYDLETKSMRKVLLLSIFCTKHCWKWNVVLQMTCIRDHVAALCVWRKCWQFSGWAGAGASIPSLLQCCLWQKGKEMRPFAAPWQTGHTSTRPRKAPGGSLFQMGQLDNASIPQPDHSPAYSPRELIALLLSYYFCLILTSKYLCFSKPEVSWGACCRWSWRSVLWAVAVSMWRFSVWSGDTVFLFPSGKLAFLIESRSLIRAEVRHTMKWDKLDEKRKNH